mmetsp:Transcript_15203/g.35809  ORF Transcript_15203/g.35809 Transcript_15203/m.35809 type:complete len:658 (+) Transcript_15203:105-2078(+)
MGDDTSGVPGRPSSRRGQDGQGDSGTSHPDTGVLRPGTGLRPMQATYGFAAPAAGNMAPGMGVPGMGPAHFAAAPLGTAATRPPTGMRMGTAQRLTTAQRAARPGSRGGVGLNTNLQVADRPVTQQGMMGMKIGAQGPGRQIADKTYYLGEIRKKNEEMTQAIDKMQKEIEQYNHDNTTYGQLERRYEALIKDVRELQGTLADYNLIVDKARASVDPADIAVQQAALRARNDTERKRVDAVFTERSTNEAQIRQIEAQIQQLTLDAEAKLNELPPEKRRRYQQLQQDHARLLGEAQKKQDHYDTLCRQLAKYENELKGEPLKQRLHILQEQRHGMEQRKRELELDTNKEQLSVPQQREKLLEQVKEDNKQIQIAERRVKEMQDVVRKLSDQLSSFESSGSAGADHTAKYEQLLAKDQEMSAFIANFEQTKAAELQANTDLERNIAGLLEHISKDITRQASMPSASRLQEMKGELGYKEMRMEQSQSTAERLQQEIELRNSELEKIKNLDAKIIQELNSLNERMKTMKEELVTFGNVEQLKLDAEAKRKAMVAQKQDLYGRKEALKQQVQLTAKGYEARKDKLAENDTYTTLEALEQKLRHYENIIFHLNDYIEQKSQDTDYRPLLEDVSNSVAELNGLIFQSLSQQTFNMTGSLQVA